MNRVAVRESSTVVTKMILSHTCTHKGFGKYSFHDQLEEKEGRWK